MTDTSVIMNESVLEDVPPFGRNTSSFHGQQSSIANVSASVSIAPSRFENALNLRASNLDAITTMSNSNFQGMMNIQTDEAIRLKKQVSNLALS